MAAQTETVSDVRNNLVIICAPDDQEVEFDRLFQLWIDRKIDFSELMKNYPDYDEAMPKKFWNWISKFLHPKKD